MRGMMMKFRKNDITTHRESAFRSWVQGGLESMPKDDK